MLIYFGILNCYNVYSRMRCMMDVNKFYVAINCATSVKCT